jgi:hypothetical protein
MTIYRKRPWSRPQSHSSSSNQEDISSSMQPLTRDTQMQPYNELEMSKKLYRVKQKWFFKISYHLNSGTTRQNEFWDVKTVVNQYSCFRRSRAARLHLLHFGWIPRLCKIYADFSKKGAWWFLPSSIYLFISSFLSFGKNKRLFVNLV